MKEVFYAIKSEQSESNTISDSALLQICRRFGLPWHLTGHTKFTKFFSNFALEQA
jgi:hypothetical protein